MGFFFSFLGVGKTTLIQKASEVLKSSGIPVDGFYTEEVRQGGRRIGFDVVTLSGPRGLLSRVGLELLPGKRECRVGQYVVDLTSFEQLALPVLRNVSKWFLLEPICSYRTVVAAGPEDRVVFALTDRPVLHFTVWKSN